MALYALGDMHLAFSVDKPMDKFGRVWRKHEQKIEKNCGRMIQERDIFVITGDHSWGKNRAEASRDLDFIAALPGKKILLRGNHDMFWDAKKTAALNREYEPRLHFLQNNYYTYRDYALVGTKGYTFEGPFYVNAGGQIIGWNSEDEAHAQKLVQREAERLRKRPALESISCFFIIRLRAFWRMRASLRRWRRNTARSMSCIRTVTGRNVSRTVSAGCTMESTIIWCPAIT